MNFNQWFYKQAAGWGAGISTTPGGMQPIRTWGDSSSYGGSSSSGGSASSAKPLGGGVSGNIFNQPLNGQSEGITLNPGQYKTPSAIDDWALATSNTDPTMPIHSSQAEGLKRYHDNMTLRGYPTMEGTLNVGDLKEPDLNSIIQQYGTPTQQQAPAGGKGLFGGNYSLKQTGLLKKNPRFGGVSANANNGVAGALAGNSAPAEPQYTLGAPVSFGTNSGGASALAGNASAGPQYTLGAPVNFNTNGADSGVAAALSRNSAPSAPQMTEIGSGAAYITPNGMVPGTPRDREEMRAALPQQSYNSNQEYIRALQRQLGVKEDGIYGIQTRNAVRASKDPRVQQLVKQMQQFNGLETDGVIGRRTYNALNRTGNAATIRRRRR